MHVFFRVQIFTVQHLARSLAGPVVRQKGEHDATLTHQLAFTAGYIASKTFCRFFSQSKFSSALGPSPSVPPSSSFSPTRSKGRRPQFVKPWCGASGRAAVRWMLVGVRDRWRPRDGPRCVVFESVGRYLLGAAVAEVVVDSFVVEYDREHDPEMLDRFVDGGEDAGLIRQDRECFAKSRGFLQTEKSLHSVSLFIARHREKMCTRTWYRRRAE